LVMLGRKVQRYAKKKEGLSVYKGDAKGREGKRVRSRGRLKKVEKLEES